MVKVKVKCTLVQALRLCTGRTAHRGNRGIALLFHDHGTRRGWGVSVTTRPLFTSRKDLVPIVQEAGWVPGLVWTGAENLAPTGIQSLYHPARSQLLYRLRYPAHIQWHNRYNNILSSNMWIKMSHSQQPEIFMFSHSLFLCLSVKSAILIFKIYNGIKSILKIYEQKRLIYMHCYIFKNKGKDKFMLQKLQKLYYET
jgi:hypothetical protein